jgi:hypothetical protein
MWRPPGATVAGTARAWCWSFWVALYSFIYRTQILTFDDRLAGKIHAVAGSAKPNCA